MRKKKTVLKQDSSESSNGSFGQKHLISCRCVLPQFKNSANPISHKFVVFSEIKDGIVVVKFAQCNNCGVIHKVTDICTSEIMQSKENMSSILSIDDIRSSLSIKLSSILDRHNCDLPTWEQAKYILENKKWGEFVVLAIDGDGDEKVIKYVQVISDGIFKVDSKSRKDTVGEKHAGL
jgi:hypothetical protein